MSGDLSVGHVSQCCSVSLLSTYLTEPSQEMTKKECQSDIRVPFHKSPPLCYSRGRPRSSAANPRHIVARLPPEKPKEPRGAPVEFLDRA